MNAILLGAASLGAIVVFFTHDPHANFAMAEPVALQHAAIEETAVPTKAIIKTAAPAKVLIQAAKARVAPVRKAAEETPDKGSMTTTVELDPKTGEKTGEVMVLAFLD